jgi:sugar O-acyltransferase (sialic acid O-acetyltransferase NeuD family)
MKERLAILGASGHGRVVGDTARSEGWESIVYFDDEPTRLVGMNDASSGGSFADLLRLISGFDGVFVAIGSAVSRQRILAVILAAGARVPVLVHRAAYVADGVSVGMGSIICAGAIVQPGVSLGVGSIVNTNASVDHDCVLGDAVHVCPGAHLAGDVRAGDRAWIGIGASVIQGVTIGADAVIGAGAAVVSDVPLGAKAVGVPARVVKSRPSV